MYRRKRIAVVMPAYNEEKLVAKALKSVPGYADLIVLVDDGSLDSTVNNAKSAGLSNLTIISHEKNRGVGAAIITGYKCALEEGCDIAVVMAGDAQMNPEDTPKLLDPLINGVTDYAKGNRLLSPQFRRGMPPVRIFGNSLLSLLTKISSGYWDIIDPQNGYTAVTRKVLEALPLDSIYPRYGYPNDILIKLNAYGFRVMDVVMPSNYGNEKSKIRLLRFTPSVAWLLAKGFVWRMKEKYVLQTFHPLVFFYITGLILLPLGILSGLYMAYLRIFIGPITPGSMILPVFLIITGLQTIFFAMLFDMEATKRS